MEKSSADLFNEVDEKDKEISVTIKNLETIHQALLDLRRQKIELDVSLSKARYLKEKMKIERSLLVNAAYHARNQGL